MRRCPSVAVLCGVVLLATWVAGPATAASADCEIWWNEVLHDTFSADYRSPVGAVPADSGSMRVRLRVAQSDLTSVRVRVWDDLVNAETYYPMAWDGVFDQDPVTYDWWVVDIPLGPSPTILHYFFELNDAGGACAPPDQDFYVDDDPKLYGGGRGTMSDAYDDLRSFQLTAYDPAFTVPDWLARATIYQIFPDRFRDGDVSNDPPAGRFFYGSPSTIVRSNQADWNSTLCDPRGTYSPACVDRWSDNFYGGDLAGITEKLRQGYFDNLGVSALYLNPIFRSPSNHKYDTTDFLSIDPDFGTVDELRELVATAAAHDVSIILDGVFNHTSSDSLYFDRYGRYPELGACESLASPYRSWYTFIDVTPGTGVCVGSSGLANSATYETWFIYDSLPRLVSSSSGVRDLIWADGTASVGPGWTAEGARGWRFDVGGDVDPGATNDPTNTYWEGFRAAVRSVDGSAITLGEEWGDASAWLLGGEWDSVMNYRFRSTLLGWLFTGCVPGSDGCFVGGLLFQDNDSNVSASSGAIVKLAPSAFNARLLSIWEDYPPPAFRSMLNLAGSHDTNRLRFLLKKSNVDSDSTAIQRMKEAWIFAFTYAGAPTLYYGDEVGLSHDGVFSAGQYEDDPYNRAPFPWDDTPGAYAAETTELLPHVRSMASIRLAYRALQDGDVVHGTVIDDGAGLYGFARTRAGSSTALVFLNRSNVAGVVGLGGLNAPPFSLADGTVMRDALSGDTYTVTGGMVSGVDVPSNWGTILLDAAAVETPAQAAEAYATVAGADVDVSWRPVTRDTGGERELAVRYEVHRDTGPIVTPGPGTLLATVTPPPFGSSDGKVHFTDVGAAAGDYVYLLRACNAAGGCAGTSVTWWIFGDGFESGDTDAWTVALP